MMNFVTGSMGRIRGRAMKKALTRISVLAALAVLILAPTVLAELQGTDGPTFLVASVKPNLSDGDMSAELSPGRFDARNLSVKNLVRIAYGVEYQRIVGGPDWVASARFATLRRSSTVTLVPSHGLRVAQGDRRPRQSIGGDSGRCCNAC